MTAQEKQRYIDQGYAPGQIEEIMLGLEAGLDVQIYDNKEFFALQMQEIRLGLMQNLPVEIYAKTTFDWFQMEEIRLGLERDLNVKLYAYPKVGYDTMRQIRKGLECGINLNKYVNLPSGVLRELRKALVSNVDILPYIEEGYDKEQLEQIRIALENGINIKPYLDKNLRGISLKEIRKGLASNLDVSEYAGLDYNWRQMREIRKGMEHQIDVSGYKNPLYDFEQMREIRLGLEDGLDVSKYSSLMYPASDMRVKRNALLKGTPEDELIDFEALEVSRHREFQIKVLPDNMSAYIQVTGDSKGITRSVIRNALEDRGIIKGVKQDVIDNIVTGKAGNQPLLIAEGKLPGEPVDGHYEFFFRTKINREPKVLEDGSLDYQNIEWFEQVKRGQKLAYYHEAEEGEAGYTIMGTVLPGAKGKQESVLYGKGFYVEPDKKTYVANVDGIVELDGNTMNVSNLLTLADVTAYMGDVKFDGNIHVTGTVGNGCTIIARDDLIVDGFVEGANLEAGGNIVLRRGVNAQNKGYVKAGKNLEGSFFESANIFAEEDVKANYCLNSNLECGGTLKLAGRKSLIVGGVTFAARQIEVHTVGNVAGVKTRICLGVKPELIRERVKLENEIKSIDKELETLEHAYEDFEEKYPPEVRNEIDLFKKIEGAMFTKKEMRKKRVTEKTEIEMKIELANKAKAVMSGDVFEGTVVEIGGKKWFSTGVKNVTIKNSADSLEMTNN